jgi:hypothetical protein
LNSSGRRKRKSETPRDIFWFHCNFGDETGTWRSKLVPKHRVTWSRVMSCMWAHISMARVVGYI